MNNRNPELNEKIKVAATQELSKPAPVEIYKSAKKKRERTIKVALCVLLATEVVLSTFFGLQIKEKQIATRMAREFEHMSTEQIATSGGIYTGSTDFGAFFGTGTFESNTGTIYQGTWNDNNLVGPGVIEVPSVGTYTGNFLDSKKSGIGTFVWDDGAVYEGDWRNDAMDGQGTYVSQNGSTYVGTFRGNSFVDGACTFSNETGDYSLLYIDGQIDHATIEYTNGVTYSGECSTAGLVGTGVMDYPDGDNYTGSYLANQRSGQGVYTWSFGDKYDGAWSSDKINGLGTYTFASGSYYTGTFQNGSFISGTYYVQNNFGEYTFTVIDGVPTAVDMVLSDGTTYQGDMTPHGKLTGSAQIQYCNGDTYSGKVNDGAKSGLGKYTWASGASYDGPWKNDKMNGRGTYSYSTSETGYKLTGTFVDGLPSGECYYYNSSSTKYKTDWIDGKCVKIYE